jgi:hypothetical protein
MGDFKFTGARLQFVFDAIDESETLVSQIVGLMAILRDCRVI